ncbi:MAG: hypothetical protein ACI3XM_03370, partial [Eubacteriales bacterium]
MKQTCNRTLSILFSLLLCTSLAACNKDGTGTDKHGDAAKKTVEPVAVDHVWKSEYINFPDQISGSLYEYSLDGELLTFNGSRLISEEPYQSEPVTIQFNVSDHTFTWTPVIVTDETTDASADGLQSYTQKELAYENGFVRIIDTYNDKTGTEYYEMLRIAEDGSELWRIDLQAQFQNETNRNWFYVNHCVMNPDTGTIYVGTDQSIVAFDGNGNRLYEITIDEYINNMVQTGSGTMYVSFYERNMETGSFGMVFRPLDDAKNGFGDALNIPDTVDFANASLYAVDGYDLMYSNDTGLFGWNFTDPEPTYLCNWVNSDVTAYNASRMVVVSDEQIIRMDYDPVTGDAQLCIMTPMAPEDVKPKYLIEVAYNENGSNLMQQYAVAFNRQSEEYRIVLNDYSNYNSSDGGSSDILNQEIISGKVPDIIIDNGYSFDMDTLSDKGLFLDLYSYMDAEDALMSRDDFLPCVLAPFENKNGELPVLVSAFQLKTIFAKKSLVGDRTVWSLDDIYALSQQLEEGQYLFSMYLSSDPEYAVDPKMQLLELLLPYSLSGFIDEETAVCTFNDGRFAKLLEFCTTCPILNAAEYENGTTGLFRDGTLVLLEDNWLYDISDYLQVKYYQFGGEDMAVIGYPTADETVKSGTALIPTLKYGINKDSAVADGAWAFIVSTFGDPGDDYYYRRSDGFQAARGALEAMFEREE